MRKMTVTVNMKEKSNSMKKFLESLRKNKFNILFVFLYLAFAGVAYYYFVIMGKMTLLNAGFSNHISTIIITTGLISLLICIPITGYMTRFIKPTKIQATAIISIILYSTLYKYIVYTHIFALCLISQVIFSILLSGYLGIFPAFICSLFKQTERCLSLGFAYNMSLSIFGASTPVLIVLLDLKFQYGDVIYLISSGILSLIALFLLVKKQYENS